jgi:hypothetical protein
MCATLIRMTSVAGEWGPNLYRHLEAHWHAVGTTQNAWSEANGFHPSTVYRWGQGKQPGLDHMQAVAAALGVTLLDVLLIAGVIDAEDVGRAAPTAPEPTSPEVAIRGDESLNDWQQRHLLDFLASIRDVGAQIERDGVAKVTRRKSRP